MIASLLQVMRIYPILLPQYVLEEFQVTSIECANGCAGCSIFLSKLASLLAQIVPRCEESRADASFLQLKSNRELAYAVGYGGSFKTVPI